MVERHNIYTTCCNNHQSTHTTTNLRQEVKHTSRRLISSRMLMPHLHQNNKHFSFSTTEFDSLAGCQPGSSVSFRPFTDLGTTWVLLSPFRSCIELGSSLSVALCQQLRVVPPTTTTTNNFLQTVFAKLVAQQLAAVGTAVVIDNNSLEVDTLPHNINENNISNNNTRGHSGIASTQSGGTSDYKQRPVRRAG